MKAKYFRVFVLYGTNIFKRSLVKIIFLRSTLSRKFLLSCLIALEMSKFLQRSAVFHSAATSVPKRNLCIASYLSIIAGLRKDLLHSICLMFRCSGNSRRYLVYLGQRQSWSSWDRNNCCSFLFLPPLSISLPWWFPRFAGVAELKAGDRVLTGAVLCCGGP